ncbi:MAG: hypothetical protein IPK82_13645 [Polyangiaceae bacterium]|nr:hypothetical protein [Polyangiaceae bacterium]
MAPRLGGAFATGALGPVHYAGQLILARKPEDGLRELTPDNLAGGVSRGVLQAAQLVGVTPSDIEQLLPMAELSGLWTRIGASQPKVMEVWKTYAGGIGGMLSGVADLTVDGRAPDTALCVARLAKKVQRDKPFAEPLGRLADDLADYQDALARCVELLNDTTALQKAYERRKFRRMAMGIGGACFGIGVLLTLTLFLVARGRVVAVIENPDPCASLPLTASDLARVGEPLRTKALANKTQCETDRAEAQKRAEEERLRAEKEKQALAEKAAMEAACSKLATDLSTGAISSEAEAVAKETAPLLGRIAKNALEASDLGPEEPAFPCKGTPAEGAISAAYQKAVLAKPWNIPKAERLSVAAQQAIEKGAGDLPTKLKRMLGTRANDASKKAIASGKPDLIAKALAACEAAKAVGTAPHGPCEGVRTLAK